MDKNTLSNYGWIVIAVLVLSVMIALATPFGSFIANGFDSVYTGLISTQQTALNNILEDYGVNTSELNTTLLAPEDTWFTQGLANISKDTITQISFNNTYSPSKESVVSWDASANQDGSIIVYAEENQLNVVSNKKIKLNCNSKKLFAGMKSLKTISGLSFLDASEVENISYAFENNYSLSSINLSALQCTNLIDTSYMFSNCYNLQTVVLNDNITSLGDRIFQKCIALKTVTGLSNITSIGNYSFVNTPNLIETDLNPEKIIHIGDLACFVSGIEDCIDLSVVSLDNVGKMATRHKRWSEESLNKLNNIVFEKSVYLPVPNIDCQKKYTDVVFAITDGVEETAPGSACSSFTLYHIWNVLYAGTNNEYTNWLDWFNEHINMDGDFVKNNNMSGVFEKQVEILGWNGGDRIFVRNNEQLQLILNRLEQGLPTYISRTSSSNPGGMHGVVAVGYNADTQKLAVVDSAATDITAAVYWIAFEDMFVEGYGSGNYDSIRPLDYNIN